MKMLSIIAAAAMVAAPLQADAGIGGRPPEGEALGAIWPEAGALIGLGVIGGVVCAILCGGGGGNPTPTTTAPSDMRVKTDITLIGETGEGFPLYRFRYVFEPGNVFHIGVMAQDLPAEMVTTGADGIMRVDYSKIDF